MTQNLSNRSRYLIDYGLLLLLWIGHTAANIWWLVTDTRPPYYDMAGNAITTLSLYTFAHNHDIASLLKATLEEGPYPPFAYLVSLLTAIPLGPSIDTFLGSEILFLGILIASVYGIARKYAGSSSGLLSAFIVSMYPIIFGLSRLYLLDVPLTAMVALALFCLFWSEAFRFRLPSVALGLALGLGMLTKWTFAVFVAGPLLVALYIVIRSWRQRWVNLLICILIALCLVAPWYLYNEGRLADFLQVGGFQAAVLEGEPLVGSWVSWRYYFDEMLLNQLLLPFFLLFVIGLVVTLIRCKRDSFLFMLLAWLMLPYVVFSNYANKDVRYTMAYLPAMALFSGIGIMQLRSKWLKSITIALVIAFALAQFMGMTMGLSRSVAWLPSRLSSTWGSLTVRYYTESFHIVSPPLVQNWPIEAILADISADAKQDEGRAFSVLGILPNVPSFEPQTFRYIIQLKQLPITTVPILEDATNNDQLLTMHYIVSKSGDLGPFWTVKDGAELAAQLEDSTSTLGAHFEMVKEYPLPYHSVAKLYRQRR